MACSWQDLGSGTGWLDPNLGNDILLDAGEAGTVLERARDDLLESGLARTIDRGQGDN